MEKYVPDFVDAGAKIIISILKGMNDHIDEIVNVATDLLVSFIEAIGRNLHKVFDAGTQMVIDTVNGVADGIRKNSDKMGEAGGNLAEALIEGVIHGIGAMIGGAVQAAANLAQRMIDSAKSKLGISSPSKEFAKIGAFVAEGAKVGVDDNAYRASGAVEAMGGNMIDKMSKTLSGLSKVLQSDLIDFDPTITPVLDLTDIRKTASELVSLLNVPTLDISSSYRAAQQTSSSLDSGSSEDTNPDAKSGGPTYNYTQNNYSPKALSPEEVYRQTKSLIAIKREEASNAQ
jgi:hypothetical protein